MQESHFSELVDRLQYEVLPVEKPIGSVDLPVDPRILKLGDGATASRCRVSAGAQHPQPVLVAWE